MSSLVTVQLAEGSSPGLCRGFVIYLGEVKLQASCIPGDTGMGILEDEGSRTQRAASLEWLLAWPLCFLLPRGSWAADAMWGRCWSGDGVCESGMSLGVCVCDVRRGGECA